MRRGGGTDAGVRRLPTANQKQECQDTEDTSNYKMCVMPLFLTLPYLHIYASFPDKYGSLIFRSRFAAISKKKESLQKVLFCQCVAIYFHYSSIPI